MRLATFNVENLYTRYLFARGVKPEAAADEGFTSEELRFRVHDPQSKQLTGLTMAATKADVFALQEVENLDLLKQFRDKFLGGRRAYPYVALLDGNDGRRMDVAVLSRLPIVHIRSFQHLWDAPHGKPVFDRDCLEVDIETRGGAVVTLYVNHFKSMRSHGRGPGRKNTRARRLVQAKAVHQIITDRFGDNAGEAAFVVAGDLNDYATDDKHGRSALGPLLDWDAVENVLNRLPASERWTHHFQGDSRRGVAETYQQLDYLLVSKHLASLNPERPTVTRVGLPGRATRYDGFRLEGVGRNHPKASDHCPLVFDLDLV